VGDLTLDQFEREPAEVARLRRVERRRPGLDERQERDGDLAYRACSSARSSAMSPSPASERRGKSSRSSKSK